MPEDEEVDDIVHVVVLDAEVVPGQGAPVRRHDGQLQAAQTRRTDLVLHPDYLKIRKSVVVAKQRRSAF